MPATSIFYAGKLIRTPMVVSEVDASGLDQAALGSSGIVAVLGTAEGGRPMSAVTKKSDLLRFSRSEKMSRAFRDGDLQDVAEMLFAPGKDPQIPGGAAEVIACKVNPSTQSTGKLQRSGTDCIDLTSKDYGLFTSQINVSLASGTTKGKLLTIRFESTIETKDNLGGDALATLQYVGTALGFNTCTMDINAAGDITLNGTRAGLGQSNLVTTNLAAPGAIEVLSSSASDTSAKTVTIYGISNLGVAQKTTVALNGTTVVSVSGFTWDTGGVLGVVLSAACVGTITVRAAGAGAVIFDLPPATLSEGLIRCEDCYVDNTTLSLVADGALTSRVAVFGKQTSGSDQQTVVTMNGTTPVVSAQTFSRMDDIAVGAVTNTRTVTVSARAARTLATTQKTLQQVRDYFAQRTRVIAGPTTVGFIFTFTSGQTTRSVADLDVVTAVDVKTLAQNLTIDLVAIVEWINNNSNLVTAAASASATGVPDNTSVPVYLTGGVEGTATFTDWQNALNFLRKIRVNSVVVLTADPAVAAALDAHCAFCCGVGRSERDGFVGLMNAGLTGLASKTEIATQIVALNSRHIRAFAQSVDRFDAVGERKTFNPPFLAAIAAGMQAGAPVGTPLTRKVANCLAIGQSSTWDPSADSEELIEAGLCFLEDVDGIGRRVVRNITTHLTTSNPAFVEGSVNASINFACFEFRDAMEFIIGRAGTLTNKTALLGSARGKLDKLVDEQAIAAHRGLQAEIVLDVVEMGVEMAALIPINFVKSVIHLRTLAQLQAGASL